MRTVEILSRPDCHLCDVAKEELGRIQTEIPFELIETNVDEDPRNRERYGLEIPVVLIDGRKRFKFRVDGERLRRILREG